MTPEIMTSVIVACVGFFIVTLVGFISNILLKNLGKVGELAISIEKLSGIIERVETNMDLRHDATEVMVKEHSRKISFLFNKAGVLKFRCEEMGMVINELNSKMGLKPYRYEFPETSWDAGQNGTIKDS